MAALSSEDRSAFTDAYRFFEKYHDMPNTDEAWRDCVSEVGEISLKHGESDLINGLLVALYGVISERTKAEAGQIAS